MNNNEKLLYTYCTLGALIDNNNNIYNDVFIPIVDKAIAFYYSEECHKKGGGNIRVSGTNQDIKNVITKIYGLNPPLHVVTLLINSTHLGIQILDKGSSFIIDKYITDPIQEEYQKNERDSNMLQKSFETYLQFNGVDSTYPNNFAQILDSEKKSFASFFTNSNTDEINIQEFYHHISFINEIRKTNDTHFKIAVSLFTGAIIASIFDNDIKLSDITNDVYFLDTNIVLKLFDLQLQESTVPTEELIDLIKETGGSVKILNITLNEITTLLLNAFDNPKSNDILSEAIKRKNIRRTWIIAFKEKLMSKNIEIEDIDTHIEEDLNRQGEKEIIELKNLRDGSSNAKHDVLAYLYVRHSKNKNPNKQYAFLVANKSLFEFNKKNSIKNNKPEIFVDTQLAMSLWLNSTKKKNINNNIGFNILIANTLTQTYNNKKTFIQEFFSLINEYVKNNPQEDTIPKFTKILLETEPKKIQQINNDIKENPDKICHIMIDLEQEHKIQEEKRTGDKISLEKQISQLQEENQSNKNSNSNKDTIIKDLKKKQNKQGKIIFWLITSIFVTFFIASILLYYFSTKYNMTFSILSLIILLVYTILFWKKLKMNKIFKTIFCSSWLWGLCNFIINLYRIIKQ